ncbi:hypothetical protein ACI6PS_03475 [Flavobacterium sp. PLA-1-15]|uniref:hypothetical protein n=1 Tax=Flavobacterium sp. PLA-1-15 TaxID=3380533 RepID=UPI003B78908D
MNKVVKWFSDNFSKSTHKLDVAAQNRKLLYESLELCYSAHSISKLKDLLNNSLKSFTVEQRIRFSLEIVQREQMIEYNKRKLKKCYYTATEINELLQNTTRHFQCNAIQLHINQHREIYVHKGDDLSKYYKMVEDRKAFLIPDIEVQL